MDRKVTAYPRCFSMSEVTKADGIVQIMGWCIYSNGNGTYSISDGQSKAVILGLPQDLKQKLNYAGEYGLIGFDCHLRVVQNSASQDWGMYGYAPIVPDLYYYQPGPGKCSCGALHTSFPDHHMKWCDCLVVS